MSMTAKQYNLVASALNNLNERTPLIFTATERSGGRMVVFKPMKLGTFCDMAIEIEAFIDEDSEGFDENIFVGGTDIGEYKTVHSLDEAAKLVCLAVKNRHKAIRKAYSKLTAMIKPF